MKKFLQQLILVFSIIIIHFFHSQVKNKESVSDFTDKEITELMQEGDIPGLSLVFIKDGKQVIKNYGYANIEKQQKVDNNTLFELASCSKAFTGLAVQTFITENKINPNSYVSDYLPWFKVYYKNKPANITLRQLMHHTSGIPWQSISRIPESSSKDALEKTVRNVVGISLDNAPGKEFEYATINYDILALIIQQKSGIAFEDYMKQNIFRPLGLTNTFIGNISPENKNMAEGYKIGYFEARPYSAPAFRGNNAAGYVIQNATDMAKWLQFQLGIAPSSLTYAAKNTQLRDETVAPHGLYSYATGWEVSLSGNGELSHSGLNPNFTSFVSLNPEKKIAVAVLANSNSSYTNVIGDKLMKILSAETLKKEYNPGDGNDKLYSIISFVMGIFVIATLFHLAILIYEIIRKERRFEKMTLSKLRNIIYSVLFISLLGLGIYLLPATMGGFSWKSAAIWMPVSFNVMIALFSLAIALSYLAYFASIFFPGNSSFRQKLPKVILISIFSGLSNMAVVIIITSSIGGVIELKYLAFYYFLTLTTYIVGRKYVQRTLIYFTRDLIYAKRINLIEKILSTTYQKFEKINRGRIYSTLNDDVGTIGNSANIIVGFVTSFITVAGAFLYLASKEFLATMLIIVLILSISALYFFISRKAEAYFEKARDTQNIFMDLLNDLSDGFKEISLQYRKKIAFKEDITDTVKDYTNNTTTAHVKFINGFLVGETTFILMLGAIAFGIPKIFPEIENSTLISLIVVLLYLNGPLGAIFSSIPTLMQVKISWERIQGFIKEIPESIDLKKIPVTLDKNTIESIKFDKISFKYNNADTKEQFAVSGVNLEVNRGEILFIIGGNGSGKTTLAKLILGLYEPISGNISINNHRVSSSQLSEYFSAVFSPCHLFRKLYSIDLENRSEEVSEYLKTLGLDEKVEITDNTFSTINLSGGQRKRLALLQCYLEDSPIYLFDEWAADQDPEYRRYFYRELLPEMKRQGKIVIAITHDDHYFDIADKILKMNMGKVEHVSNDYKVDEVLN